MWMLRALCALLGVVLLCPAAMAEEGRFPAALDVAYEGALIVDAFPAEGGARLNRDHGVASLSFAEAEDGAIQFVGTSDVEGKGGMAFEAALIQGEDGTWRDLTGAGVTLITGEGRISSVMDLGENLVTMAGRIEPQRIRLEITHRPHPMSDEVAGGPLTRFHFDVTPPAAQVSDGGENAEDGSCSRIEWRLRNSPNLFGGGMSLIRVPVCIP